jgi:hypothetical protein
MHTLLLTALSTRESKKRENIARIWRRSIVAYNGCIQRFGGRRSRKFGLVLTSQRMTGAPFNRCRRRGTHHSRFFGLVLAAARASSPKFLHHDTGV